MTTAQIIAICASGSHSLKKKEYHALKFVKNYGIEGDTHAGKLVKHRSRVKRDPNQPNLRQVHLISSELLEGLKQKGYILIPGQMGENITTKGIPLLELPENTLLYLGAEVIIKVTGLRNPCTQLDGIQAGLMNELIDRNEDGSLRRKAGIMAIVLAGGMVYKGDKISWVLPVRPHRSLKPV